MAEPAVASARYPRAVIARPLTFPEGVLGFGADATSNKDGSTMFGSPIAGYGFTDKAELQVGYSFATNSFEPKGASSSTSVTRDPRRRRRQARGDRARTHGLRRTRQRGDPAHGRRARPVQRDAEDLRDLRLRGQPADRGLGRRQCRRCQAVVLQLPVAVGVQPTELFYLQLDTKLGRINFHDSTNALFGRDETPLALTAVYNVMNALDVQAAIGADLSADAIGDSFSVLVGARYYAGRPLNRYSSMPR